MGYYGLNFLLLHLKDIGVTIKYLDRPYIGMCKIPEIGRQNIYHLLDRYGYEWVVWETQSWIWYRRIYETNVILYLTTIGFTLSIGY